MKIIWHSKAKQDLNETIKHISLQSPKYALRVLETLLLFINTLENFPFAYPKEPIFNDESIRFVSKWSYKIIYKIDKDVVYILRIFNTNQFPGRIKE